MSSASTHCRSRCYSGGELPSTRRYVMADLLFVYAAFARGRHVADLDLPNLVLRKSLMEHNTGVQTTCHSTHFHTSSSQLSTRQSACIDDVDPLAHLPSFITIRQNAASPEHISFLSRQGALDIPTLPLQRALVEAYIEFAYPYMPIIHLEEFLSIINTSRSQERYATKISLLLYQAILFAGSAFVDEQLLERESPRFSTRRLAREELARRVRVCQWTDASFAMRD
jgi:hypothetical protein